MLPFRLVKHQPLLALVRTKHSCRKEPRACQPGKQSSFSAGGSLDLKPTWSASARSACPVIAAGIAGEAWPSSVSTRFAAGTAWVLCRHLGSGLAWCGLEVLGCRASPGDGLCGRASAEVATADDKALPMGAEPSDGLSASLDCRAQPPHAGKHCVRCGDSAGSRLCRPILAQPPDAGKHCV